LDKPLDVVGIGNAIVDVLATVDDSFLEDNGIVKGAMTLIDTDQAESLYAKMGSTTECSGGSAANSMVGIASLGGHGAFIGKVREDALGEVFTRDIREAGVEFNTPPGDSGPPTGRCLILVSPDAERTLQTYLGTSANLGAEDIDPYTISRARYTYLEGYLWDLPEAKDAFVKAARVAHEAKCKVALTLSDAFCVERHRSSFQHMVSNHVDVLFANEDEVVSLYQAASFDEAVGCMKGQCEVAALTRGAKGSVVLHGDEVYEIAAAPAEVVDTTGAGDLFAAGFLYGLTHGYGISDCARIGGIAAAEVISHLGARPLVSLAELVQTELRKS
jgi:sugar/nucleoside kinase (ribokinase family)